MRKLLEVWKKIPEFPDYSVSNLGKVRRDSPGNGTQAGKILAPVLDSYEYIVQSLHNKKKGKDKKVHRLVLEAFVGPCPKGHHCNHKNGIKSHNWTSNLEWCTPSENTKHSWRIGLSKPQNVGVSRPCVAGENNGNVKLKGGEIWLIRRLYNYKIKDNKNGEIFYRGKIKRPFISKMFKVSDGQIRMVGGRRGWKHI